MLKNTDEETNIELTFYPEYNPNEWDLKWVEEINNYIVESYHLITKYIPYTSFPTIVFISKEYSKKILEDLELPQWTNAFTVEGTIYLININNTRWRSSIDHEMFHARANLFLDNLNIMPEWFNECIAYYIGKNCYINASYICEYVEKEFSRVQKWFEEDQLMIKDSMGYSIVKSMGVYICNTYNEESIKEFIKELKNLKDFNSVMKKVFKVDNSSLLEKWFEYLKSISNMTEGFQA